MEQPYFRDGKMYQDEDGKFRALCASICLISSVYKEIGYGFFIHSQTSHRPGDFCFWGKLNEVMKR